MDLTITNQQLPVIEVNYEEVKQELSSNLKFYKNLVVTDETLSVCKAQQKSLAGLRAKIDAYRKEIKKKMSEPIVAFEEKMKGLGVMIDDVEKPIKEGIKVFDDAKREEKRQAAEKIISQIVAKHELKEKYASQITVADKYTNLTATSKDVKDDVEQRVFVLLGQQQKEEEMLELIQDTIDNVNKTIKKQLTMSDFQRLINAGVSTKEVIAAVNKQAENIREAENPPPVVEVPQEKPVQANVQVQPVQESIPIAPFDIEKLYYVELRITGTKEQVAVLGQYLKTNNYTYAVTKKSEVE